MSDAVLHSHIVTSGHLFELKLTVNALETSLLQDMLRQSSC